MAVHIFNLRNRLQLVVARAGAQDVEQWGAFPVVEYQQHMIGLRSPPKQVGLPGAWGFIGHYFLYLLVSSCTLYFAMGKTEVWVISQQHFGLKSRSFFGEIHNLDWSNDVKCVCLADWSIRC